MSITKNIQMSEFNRTDYDILLPQTRLDFELGNEYVWAKEQWNWEAVKSKPTNQQVLIQSNNTNRPYIRYSDNVILDNDGNISLAEPITQIYPTYNSAGSLQLNDKYIQLSRRSYTEAATNPVWFSYGVTSNNTDTYYLDYGTVNALHRRTLLGYVNSPSSDAYPPAVSDGYTYALLGQIGSAGHIATGSYIGTGMYGSSNPNSLTFDVLPKLILFYQPSFADYGHIWTSYSLYGGTGWSGNLTSWEVTIKDTTVSWYVRGGHNINAMGQFNVKDEDYYYIYFE